MQRVVRLPRALSACRAAVWVPSRFHGSHGHSHLHPSVGNSRENNVVLSAGLLSDFGLALLKGAAGLFSGSSALISDAIHSTSDMLISVSALLSFRMSKASPDFNHPYGHGRFDSLGALGVASVLVASGGTIGYKSCQQMLEILDPAVPPAVEAASTPLATPLPVEGAADGSALSSLWSTLSSPPDISTILYNTEAANMLSQSSTAAGVAIGACLVSLAVKEWIYRWTMRVGMASRSNVMIASAYHHRADSLSSAVALVGIGAAHFYDMQIMDPLAGAIVAGMTCKLGFDTGLASLRELLDERLDDDIIASAVDTARKHDDIKSIRSVRARRMGPSVLLDMECAMTPNITVAAAHKVAQQLRAEVFRERKEVSELLIHFVPAGPHDHLYSLRKQTPSHVLPSTNRTHPDAVETPHGHSHGVVHQDEEHAHSHGAHETPDVSVEEIKEKVHKLLADIHGIKAVSQLEVHAESASSRYLHIHAKVGVDLRLQLRDALAVTRRAKQALQSFTVPVNDANNSMWKVSQADVELDDAPV